MKKASLLRNLNENTVTYLAVSRKVPGQIGVFASVKMHGSVEPFAIANSSTCMTKEVIWLSQSEVSALPPHSVAKIKQFCLPQMHRGVLCHPIPEGGLNTLDISYYLNCATTQSEANCVYDFCHDSRNMNTILTKRVIEPHEELLLPPYPIVVGSTKCVECRSEIRDDDMESSYVGCSCEKGTRCRSCSRNKILPRVRLVFSRGHVSKRFASCDICSDDVSDVFVDEICLVADGDNTEKAKDDALKNLNISAYALVLSSANCSGGNTASFGRLSCGANKDPFAKEVCKPKRGRGSGHATASVFSGIDAITWMEEDRVWVKSKIWEYVSAAERTKKTWRIGGPTRTRGQFRFTFYNRSSRKYEEDYFSEGDDSVRMQAVPAPVKRVREGE
jgi:hypothetical protein